MRWNEVLMAKCLATAAYNCLVVMALICLNNPGRLGSLNPIKFDGCLLVPAVGRGTEADICENEAKVAGIAEGCEDEVEEKEEDKEKDEGEGGTEDEDEAASGTEADDVEAKVEAEGGGGDEI
jgi:hypothetical protein